MKKSKFTVIMTVLALSLLVVSGCTGSKNNTDTQQPQGSAAVSATPTKDTGFKTIPQGLEDSSNLPDWTGKQLKLSFWDAHGVGGTYGMVETVESKGDVVTPELKRVTGVEEDKSKSFDNAGQTAAVKMGLLVASGDWPDVVLNPEESLKKLVEAGKVYDLTDLLPKYAPNIVRRVPQSIKTVWDNPYINAGQKGKVYAIPTKFNPASVPVLDPTVDSNKFPGQTPYQTIMVRDDVVKKLFPNAKTMQEIQELYVKKGKFAKEDLMDVQINSKDDFFKFLRDIKALGLKEGNKAVSPFPVFAGQDNWALMTFVFGALNGATLYNDYFSYWDKETKKMEWGFKQPLFKETLLAFNQLVRDGTASKESLVDPYNVFNDKLNNGEYAITYAWLGVNPVTLKQNGKTFQYRPVLINIPVNNKKFVYPANPVQPVNAYAIFKDKVKEEDLPQVLRYFDFQMSEAGEKLHAWGPKSAGLFDEANGQRIFKDKELEAHMVYGAQNEKGKYYNLYSGFNGIPSGPETYGSTTFSVQGKFAPANTYSKERKPEEAAVYFDLARIAPEPGVNTVTGFIGNFTAALPEADKAWKARKSVEDALTKILAASSDAEFEKLYESMLQTADKAGYNDATLAKIDSLFRQMNADNMKNIQ